VGGQAVHERANHEALAMHGRRCLGENDKFHRRAGVTGRIR
jgi:hypothetical protein